VLSLGLGPHTVIAISFLLSVTPIALNTLTGIRNVPPMLPPTPCRSTPSRTTTPRSATKCETPPGADFSGSDPRPVGRAGDDLDRGRTPVLEHRRDLSGRLQPREADS
jgi:hypothetical protein